MEQFYLHKPPLWYSSSIVGAFIYNIFGVASLIQAQMLDLPGWVDGAYWLAVVGCTAGALMLLLGAAMAVPLFGLGLAGIMISRTYELYRFLHIATDLSDSVLMSMGQMLVGCGMLGLSLWAYRNDQLSGQSVWSR